MKRQVSYFVISIWLSIILFTPIVAQARVGVGVNTAKINIAEVLKSGMHHSLPAITIINTGDEAANYQLSLAFQSGQIELRPNINWFHFDPASINLDPGESAIVNIDLQLPAQAQPGDYFAYLEARPNLNQLNDGKTAIGIAAATKLSFTVEPATWWQGYYFRLLAFWQTHAVLMNSIVIVLVALIVLIILRRVARRYLKIKISVRSKLDNNTKNKHS